jgi:hypothetical protein
MPAETTSESASAISTAATTRTAESTDHPSPSGSDGGTVSAAPAPLREKRLYSPDRKLALDVPIAWRQRPCRVEGDHNCIDASPPGAGDDEFINGSFTGMNPIEGSPIEVSCLKNPPGLPAVPTVAPPSGINVPTFRSIRAAGYPAVWIDTPDDGQDSANSPRHISAMVCMGHGTQSPFAVAWVICSLGKHPYPGFRAACDRAIATFVPRG